MLNVKLLQPKPGLDARAAFIDFETVEIATSAHEAENRIGTQVLRTDYNNRGQQSRYCSVQWRCGYLICSIAGLYYSSFRCVCVL